MFSDRGREPLGISQQLYHQPALLRRKGAPYVQHIPFFSGQGNRVSIFGKKLRQGDPKPPMVDWESPQFFASVYSDQFLSVRSLTISSRIFNLAHIPQYLQAYNSALYITCLKSLFRYFHWPSIYGWFYSRSRSFLLIGMCLFSFSS